MSSSKDPTVGPLDETMPGKPSAQPPSDLAIGTKVGRYEVLRPIGRGGMGIVYAAHDPQLDRQIALKLLAPSIGTPAASLIGEAKALARLDDPHVVQVYDAGTFEGAVYIAMQLVAGDDLHKVLKTQHPSWDQIVALFVEAGRGLDAAHRAGVVHRDFKPSNVLVDRRGRVAVTDFGLAVSVHDTNGRELGLSGTPLYMAPEQHALATGSFASDQFAFCVSLWEALFGQHPFVSREETLLSPFAIGHLISETPLVTPPRSSAVPRRIIDALSRGLSREASARWPSMTELLTELAPPRRRRTWPMLALGAVAAASVIAALYFYIERTDSGTSCELDVATRLAHAWSPFRATIQRPQFAASSRSHALLTADQVTGSLDRYAQRWHELASEVCTSDHESRGNAAELVARKRACLDGSLDRVRAVADVFDTPTANVVDHASDILATLPELADCAEPKALFAGPNAPPLAIAGLVGGLDEELDRITALQASGSTQTLDRARSLLARAEAVNWAPAIARAHVAVGHALAVMYQPALDELVRGAELAIASHLDREAIKAWSSAFAEAAYETKPDVIELLVTEARSTAARIGDPALVLAVEVSYGRALIQSQRWDEGLSICRPAIAAAEKLASSAIASQARDCLFEGLYPAAKFDELHTVAAERVASTTERFGPDAPAIATYELVLADVDTMNGKLGDARQEIDRASRVVTKAYPDGHNLKVAEVLRTRASVEAAEGNMPKSIATLREARGVAMAIVPKPVVIIADMETALAVALAQNNDMTEALHYFGEAIATVRAHGPDTVPLAILLLNYGQLVGTSDFEAGLRATAEARQILDRKHDPRISYASAAMAVVEAQHQRWQDAKAHAEEALEFATRDPDAVPANTAELQFVLARALVETRGDKRRAITLGRQARMTYAKLGPGSAPLVATIDHWLAAHR